jgi:hypothetical protein
MNFNLAQNVPQKIWALLILCLWGGAIIGLKLIRFDEFGIDEGAAMALLLNWSVSDQVVSPVATYGGPDFRALLFIPLGLYWPGSVTAAKVFTLLAAFGAIWFLYQWSREKQDQETALIASGLMLLSPLLLLQIDAIGLGPYLLALFAIGAYVDKKYRASTHIISSLYFVQLLLVSITVTLHPMGLAYPAALVWRWAADPKSDRQKKQVWLGIACAVAIILAMHTGWVALQWANNPLNILNDVLFGSNVADPFETRWPGGITPALILLFVVVRDFKTLSCDLLGSMLLVGAIIGLCCADQSWGLIITVLLLYRGIPALIALNKKIRAANFIGQRGLVMVALVCLSTLFMLSVKTHAIQIRINALSPVDQLIERLAQEAANKDNVFVAASQWPAKSMLVCKRDVFKLPPAVNSSEELYALIKNLTHILFDHNNPKNIGLARQIAELGPATETIELQPSGVIVKIREPDMESRQTAPTPVIPNPPAVK